MDLGIAGRRALVVGGSRGIGAAVSRVLAQEGCRVAVWSRSERAEQTVAELRQAGAEAAAFRGDVTSAVEAERVVAAVEAAVGGVDILVNCAGASHGGALLETSDAEWRAAFELNVLAAARLLALCVPGMRRRGWGRVVLVSSMWGREAGGKVSYNATKAALISLAKAAALESGVDNVLVNSVAPGSTVFPGGSWQRRLEQDPEGTARFQQEYALRRLGRPEEIADVIAFLASERASFVTGASVPVDGGWSRAF